MYRLVLIFIILEFSIINEGISQVDLKEVDSISYSLYSQKDWLNLSEYGDSLSNLNVDNYYFNLRIGIAHYNIENYKKSNSYFNKALKSNPENQVANEYLFWGHTLLNNEITAYSYYKSLEDSIKNNIEYKPRSIIESIFIEPGIKISNNNIISDNMIYANIGLNHKFSPRFSIYHSFTNLKQKLIWGDFKQQEYYISPSYNINDKWNIKAGIHYAAYKSDIDYLWYYFYKNSPPQFYVGSEYVFHDTTNTKSYSINGNYQQDALLCNLSVKRKWEHLEFSPFISIYNEWQNPDYIEETSDSLMVYEIKDSYILKYTNNGKNETNINNKLGYRYQLYCGADIKFSFKSISFGNNFIFTNNSSKGYFFYNPYISLKLTKTLYINASYFEKDFNVVPLNNGEQLLNSRDSSKKTTIIGNFLLNKRVNLFLTYQNEKIGDSLTKLEYKFNSIFIGLKIKL